MGYLFTYLLTYFLTYHDSCIIIPHFKNYKHKKKYLNKNKLDVVFYISLLFEMSTSWDFKCDSDEFIT